MVRNTDKILNDIILGLNKKGIKILELGSGLDSTVFFRKQVSLYGGFCFSLESDKFWYQKVTSKLPNDIYGSVLFCKINSELQYDYDFDEKFDLILIDGPSPFVGNQLKKAKEKMNGMLFNIERFGYQSFAMLDYVLNFCHTDSIIVLDGRLVSLCNYWSKYSKSLLFYGSELSLKEEKKAKIPKFTYTSPTPNGFRWVSVICDPRSQYKQLISTLSVPLESIEFLDGTKT